MTSRNPASAANAEGVAQRRSQQLRLALVAALTFGAFGIALLWVGGVDFPVAIPPGMVILGVGAILVAAVRRRWTAWLGCGLGLFVLGGFLLSGNGFDIIGGSEGTIAAIGQTIEVLGVLVASVTGALLGVRRA
jgi:hypothetical protein